MVWFVLWDMRGSSTGQTVLFSHTHNDQLQEGMGGSAPLMLLRKWPKYGARSLQSDYVWMLVESVGSIWESGGEKACCLSKTLQNIMIYLSEEKIWIMYWLYGAWISFVLIVRKTCIQCVRGGGAGGLRDHRGAAAQSRQSYSHSHWLANELKEANWGGGGGVMKAVVGLEWRNNLGPPFSPLLLTFFLPLLCPVLSSHKMVRFAEVDCRAHQYVNKVGGV